MQGAYTPNSLRQKPLERSSSELLLRGLFTEPPPELVVLDLTPSRNKNPAKRTSNRASLTSTETLSLTSSAQPLARPEEEPMQPRAAFCGLLCFRRPPSTRALGGSSRSFSWLCPQATTGWPAGSGTYVVAMSSASTAMSPKYTRPTMILCRSSILL